MSLITKIFGVDPLIQDAKEHDWVAAEDELANLLTRYADASVASEFKALLPILDPILTALAQKKLTASEMEQIVVGALAALPEVAPSLAPNATT